MSYPCSEWHQGNVAIMSHKDRDQIFVLPCAKLGRLFEIGARPLSQSAVTQAETHGNSMGCPLNSVNLYDPRFLNHEMHENP